MEYYDPRLLFPFGKKAGMSPEQVIIKDYKYFIWFYNKVENINDHLKERLDKIYYIANNFQSEIICPNCDSGKVIDRVSFYFAGRKKKQVLEHAICVLLRRMLS